jgi:lysophospholipase L1-like esterase
MTPTKKLFGAAALGALLVAACHNDQLLRPQNAEPVDQMFARYVSLGNSITAGFQSGGINDSTQLQAYPVLLAQQMHSQFFVPLLNRPGCPPPLVNVFLGTVVGGASAPPCALRKPQDPPLPYLSNVAVPGAAVEDILSNLSPASSANALTTFILGGLTQSQVMQRTDPTFVTVWIGNNDVLGAATDPVNGGDPAKVTSPTAFAARYDSLLDAIDQTSAAGQGVLIGVGDVAAIPYFSYGLVYFGAYLQNQLPPAMTVSLSCAPMASGGVGDTTLVPFRYGATLLGLAAAGVPDTLNCLDDHNITPSEIANLHASVAAYNSHIAAAASSRGYAYFDPNIAFAQLRADTSQVVIFPHFPPTPNDNSPGVVERPFGSAFSRDGVHPSAATHKLVTNALILAINAKYGTTLQPIP